VARAGGVDDRRDHVFGDLVAHDERQVRLRQETRLEHTPAVLVGDPLLAPVADGLEDRDADVAGLGLHRLHHGLHAIPDDHRLDLHHIRSPPWTTKKAPPPAGRERRGVVAVGGIVVVPACRPPYRREATDVKRRVREAALVRARGEGYARATMLLGI
jgi:hypothetical protein